MSKRRRIGGIAAVAAAVATPGMSWAGSISGAQSAPTVDGPRLQLAAGDPFGIAKFSTSAEPEVFSGHVSRRSAPGAVATATSAAASPADRVRVDVYLDPVGRGRLYPLAFALTDASGNYRVNADPPADLATYQAPGGLIDTTVIYSDLDTGAVRTGVEQIEWSGANRAWRRVTPDGPGGTTQPQATIELTAPVATPAEQAARARLAATSASVPSGCKVDDNPKNIAGWDLALPPTWTNVFDALAEDVDANDWKLDADYETVNSTTIDNLDSIAIDANFAAEYKGISLGVSGSAKVSTGTGNSSNSSLGYGFSIENLPTTMSAKVGTSRLAEPDNVHLGRTINLKYGIDLETTGHLLDCFNAAASYVAGVPVYVPAMYALQVGPDISTDNGAGFETRDGFYLDDVQKGTGSTTSSDYRQRCGPAFTRGDETAIMPPGVSFSRKKGQSQTFTRGEQFTLSGSLSSQGIVGVGASYSQSKASTVTNAANVSMKWTNSTAGTKYLCGYGDSPNVSVAAPPIVGAGSHADGT